MTEAEWLNAADPRPMLRYLRRKRITSPRKLRLFAIACCRRFQGVRTDERLSRAAETAERYADERATYQEMVQAAKSVDPVYYTADPARELAATLWLTTAMGVWWQLWPIARTLRALRHLLVLDADEGRSQADLVRDLCGNPSRPAPLPDPAWLTPKVLMLAHRAYEERKLPEGTLDPALLAAFAGALEETECDNAEILGHLHGPGIHVRGCWALDLLLSKE